MGPEFLNLAPTLLQIYKSGEAKAKSAKRIVYGQAVSNSSGVATLYFTDNGSSTGNPLLTSIDYAVASVYSTDSNIGARPRVQMREKNISGKYVSANVTYLNGVSVLGIAVLGSEMALGNVTVDFMILGSFQN